MCANLRKVVTVWSRKAFLSAAAAAAAAALSSALLLLLLLTLLLLSVRAPATAKQSTRHCTSSACTPRVLLLLLLLLLVVLVVTTLVLAAVCKSLPTACTRDGVVKICTLNLNRLSEEYKCTGAGRNSVSRHAVKAARSSCPCIRTERSYTKVELKEQLDIVHTIANGLPQRVQNTH
eukprot:8969-Heterococcus_DN1.PRE.1